MMCSRGASDTGTESHANTYVTSSPDDVDKIIQTVLDGWSDSCPLADKVVGLNAEFVGNNQLALIQIAFANDLVVLFQVHEGIQNGTLNALPRASSEFLLDRTIIVTGVGAIGDCVKISDAFK
ncbi:hypothetical protein HDU98_008298 [Podochytrium sp. JEL0797]|nr:hypothetical protein HDU98_008298 [Podochytrium sp. JEL0797]